MATLVFSRAIIHSARPVLVKEMFGCGRYQSLVNVTGLRLMHSSKDHPKLDIDEKVKENLKSLKDKDFSKEISNPENLSHFKKTPSPQEWKEITHRPGEDIVGAKPDEPEVGTDALPHPICDQPGWKYREYGAHQNRSTSGLELSGGQIYTIGVLSGQSGFGLRPDGIGQVRWMSSGQGSGNRGGKGQGQGMGEGSGQGKGMRDGKGQGQGQGKGGCGGQGSVEGDGSGQGRGGNKGSRQGNCGNKDGSGRRRGNRDGTGPGGCSSGDGRREMHTCTGSCRGSCKK